MSTTLYGDLFSASYSIFDYREPQVWVHYYVALLTSIHTSALTFLFCWFDPWVLSGAAFCLKQTICLIMFVSYAFIVHSHQIEILCLIGCWDTLTLDVSQNRWGQKCQRRIKKPHMSWFSPLTLCLKDSKRGREQNTMHTFELCSTTKSVLPESVHWYFLNIPSDFFV